MQDTTIQHTLTPCTNPPPSLEELVDKIARQLEAIEKQIETINGQLRKI